MKHKCCGDTEEIEREESMRELVVSGSSQVPLQWLAGGSAAGGGHGAPSWSPLGIKCCIHEESPSPAASFIANSCW